MKKLIAILVVFALIFSATAVYAAQKGSKTTTAQPVEKTGNIFEDFVTLITKQIPNTPRSDTYPEAKPATGKKKK